MSTFGFTGWKEKEEEKRKEGKRARNKRMEPLPLERRGEKRGWMRGEKGRGETFRVLINCFYHRLLCSNLLSSISHPFFSLFLYFILRLPSSSSPLPFFCPRAKSMGIYRCGRARGRNSFRRNEVMKSDPTSLTGLIGLIWRSLYVDKLQGCVHWDAHQLLPWLFAPTVQFIVPSTL